MSSARSMTKLPHGVHVGATGPRLLAALVEVGPTWLLLGLAVLFGVALDRVLIAGLSGVLALAWAIIVWTQRAAKAAGPGMRLDGLQIVGFHDGRPIGWGRVLVRWLVFAGLTVTVVGLIAMLVVMMRHPRRQGWHDRAADAVVIMERPLAPPRHKQPAIRTHPTPARTTTASPAGPPTPTAPTPTAPVTTAPHPTAPPVASAPSPAPTATLSPASPAVDDAGDQPSDASDLEWWLRLDDGRDVGVDRLVLLGRNPQPRVGEEDATLIKVSDEGRTVSKSHLAVGVDAGGLYVMDRGSTNGTTVTAPDGGQRPCPPGDLIDVTAGSMISFGDHWLEVRRPGRV